MQHKKKHNNSLISIKLYVRGLNKLFTQKSDIELLKIISDQKPSIEAAKNIIIYRYLPKIIKDSKIIFNGQTINSWDQDEIIHTGIKAILYAINDFLNKDKNEQSPALFTYMVSFYITKYLNRKKINYDPLIQFSKGAAFKKVFYKYFKVLKVLIKENGDSKKICEKKLCTKLDTDIKTLREVQFVHQQLPIIKSQEDHHKNSKNTMDGSGEENQNFIDYAMSQNLISEIPDSYDDPENIVIKREPRKIRKYKIILSKVEYKFLDLLNSGKTKKQITNDLKISKQRFSYLTKNITKKINIFEKRVY